MRRILAFSLAHIFFFAVFASAQVQTGSILVRAFDDQGAVVPGATITITSSILPQAINGVTDTGGVYRIPGLAAGTYKVTTSLTGFQTVIRDEIILVQGQTVTLDFKMKLSSLSESVTVTARPGRRYQVGWLQHEHQQDAARSDSAARTSGTCSSIRRPASSWNSGRRRQ